MNMVNKHLSIILQFSDTEEDIFAQTEYVLSKMVSISSKHITLKKLIDALPMRIVERSPASFGSYCNKLEFGRKHNNQDDHDRGRFLAQFILV